MPPRFVYWTVLIDGKPTAFRAREKEELLPTVAQLRRTNQDVVVKWFARGKLWDSPDAEIAAQYAPVRPVEKRNRDWRPGGTHQDPRDRFKKKNRPERAWSEEDRDRDKARRPKPAGQGRPPRSDRPWQTKPTGPRADRKPWSPKPAGAPSGDRRPPRRSPNTRPAGGGGWQNNPSGPPRPDRKPWENRPSGPPRRDSRPPRRGPNTRPLGGDGKKKRNDDPDKG
jgi:hypothetical protein